MKPRPSGYNGAILKNLVLFLRKVKLFLLQLRCSKKEDRLRGVGSFIKPGCKLWRWENGLAVARSPPSAMAKVTSRLAKATPSASGGTFSPLSAMQQGRKRKKTSWLREKFR